VANPARLTPLDVATGRMLGEEAREPLPRLGRRTSLDGALFSVMEPALASGRCLVAFSGGRESSWILAVATAGAREHGYPDPVPVTFRFAGGATTHATVLQEQVVSHLGLEDWEHVEIGDEFEMLGSYARRALAEAGVLFPANLFVFLPLLARARGGWLLAGGGLTDFLLYWRWAGLADVFARRRRPRRRDARDLADAVLPWRAQGTLPASRRAATMPWLREDAARAFDALAVRRATDVPLSFEAALREQRTHRCHLGTERSLNALATASGARLSMPLRDDRFMAAFASVGGRHGFGNRSSIMERVVGHLLPENLGRSSDGNHPNRVFYGDASRAFVERWSGNGLDTGVVDPGRLRSLWASGTFPWQATVLFQLALVHDEIAPSTRYEFGTSPLDAAQDGREDPVGRADVGR
jgi:asparagine synthase (glutamine-hydrolysing)